MQSIVELTEEHLKTLDSLPRTFDPEHPIIKDLLSVGFVALRMVGNRSTYYRTIACNNHLAHVLKRPGY
jgi:hypothetical protein